MKINIHILTADSQKLAQRRNKLKAVVRKTVRAVSSILKNAGEVDIILSVNPETTIPETGIGGYTPNSHTIYISLDPQHPKFSRSVKTELPRTLAHELHHAVRWTNPGYGHTLGAALVTEGLAAHFELEVFGGKPNMWDIAVRGKELQKLLQRAKRELANPNYDHQAWFFGSSKRKIPRWTGYALGFSVVGQYLATHHQPPSVLVHTKAENILLGRQN